MEAGTREGPKSKFVRQFAETTAEGLFDGVVANVLKGIGYTQQYVAGDNLVDVDKTTAYRWGDAVSRWAKMSFPGDEARQLEFATQLGQGTGSMIGFFGPALAANILLKAGPKTMLAIAGGTGGVTQSGDMADDARTAHLKDPGKVTEENIRNAYVLGLPIGASEAIPLAGFLGRGSSPFLQRVWAQVVEEGGQEWAQTVAENVVARQNYDDKRHWDDGAWDGALVGGLLGAKMQVAGEAWTKAQSMRRRGECQDGPAVPTEGPDSATYLTEPEGKARPGSSPQLRKDEKAPAKAVTPDPYLDDVANFVRTADPETAQKHGLMAQQAKQEVAQATDAEALERAKEVQAWDGSTATASVEMDSTAEYDRAIRGGTARVAEIEQEIAALGPAIKGPAASRRRNLAAERDDLTETMDGLQRGRARQAEIEARQADLFAGEAVQEPGTAQQAAPAANPPPAQDSQRPRQPRQRLLQPRQPRQSIHNPSLPAS